MSRLLHGDTPWLVGTAAVETLVRELAARAIHSAPEVRLAGERLRAAEAVEPDGADVIVLAPAPSQLQQLLLQLPLQPGQLIASADVPLPDLPALAAIRCERHVFHLYDAPVGAAAAAFDETHQLAVVHPQYDGFLVATITAYTQLSRPTVVVTQELAQVLTPHCLDGPIAPGQQRPVDLELHPGVVPPEGVDGTVQLHEAGSATGVELRVTLATTSAVDALLAGRTAGPLPAQVFDELVSGLRTGRLSGRDVARSLSRAEQRGGEGRGWRRRGRRP